MGNQPPMRTRSQDRIQSGGAQFGTSNAIQEVDNESLTELDSLLSPSTSSNSRVRLPSFSFYNSTPSPVVGKQVPASAPAKYNGKVGRKVKVGVIPTGPPASIRKLLYLGHFTSQWAERTWEFTIVLLLTAIGPTDMELLLPSTYGLFCCLSSLLGMGAVGAYIDRSSRISAFRAILVWQNISVAACTVACYVLLVMKENACEESNFNLKAPFFQDPFTTYLLIFIHVMGASAQMASQGSSVSIEKDWVPEISKEYADHGWLTQTNVQMRQIDLGCKVIAPVFAGVVVAWGGEDMKPACVAMGVFNLLTVMVEWASSKRVYDMV
eukprot:CAMPEP_0118663226 /NCGR_PEP_ID=MMETSP0785-20121206/17294_1 /TAXON_ID=91992 /ORGANISM="Bolidomonas pacifica, Strain CCMP 1866" /LENGTH=323 /DNA_ID=CAMNT_0006556907 /DNA_START=67 /DNA_END=1035 /DNA_ORIENTATION=-